MRIDLNITNNKDYTNNIIYLITKIKEKDNGVIIYLDNKEKINISVDNYFKYSINSLKGLNQDLYDLLKNEERIYLGYLCSLRKLSIKDYTNKQIHDFLMIKKSLNEDEIKIIIDKLTSFGLLDDEMYCQNRYNYLCKQLLSYKQIRNKLNKEGINNELIEKYVINNIEQEYDKACKLAIKYSGLVKNKPTNAKRQSILNKLVNAGYSYDTSKSAVDCIKLSNDNELDLLKKEYIKAKEKYSKKYEKYELRKHIYSYLLNKGFVSEDIKSIMEE